MKKISLTIILISVLCSMLLPQECGPSCPVCSGTADGSLLAVKSILFTSMYIPNGEEEQGRLNLRYGAFAWLDMGIGYAINTKKIIWNARAQVIKENEEGWRPGIILGSRFTFMLQSHGNFLKILHCGSTSV